MNIYDIDGNVISVDLDTDTDDIAPYYEEELELTANSIKEAQNEPCLTFALITDIHYNSVDKVVFPNSIKNIKALSKKIRLDGVMCLGDMTDGNKTQEITTGLLDEILPLLMNVGVPVYFTSGNHDCNAYGAASNCYTTKQMFANYYKYFANSVFYDPDSYGISYYKDFDEFKIRLIALDATNSDSGSGSHYKYSANTVSWFTNVALEGVPSGYSVMLLTHLSPTASHNWNSTVPSNSQYVRTAINTFIANGGTVFSFIGHSHSDFSFSSPYLDIAIHCNKMEFTEDHVITENDESLFPTGAKQWAGEYGSSTEDCWDVAVIKPGSRTIDTIRFGRGEDRTFSY